MNPYLMSVYANQLPVRFERGQGAWLWDTENHKYLDAVAGLAVCGLGHAHPAVAQTICDQAKKLLHTSNCFQTPNQERLAKKLVDLSGMEQVFFCNSGAEANEAAIKLTRLHARKKNINHPIVITMEKAFHGRTMATLSASGSDRLQVGYEPLVPAFIHVPLNDLDKLAAAVTTYKNQIVAIMLEPIQGDGGIQAATRDYMHAVRHYCDQHGWLMLLDEIQTGLCRTGSWFAYQNHEILPDVLTLAKALGNGIPIGACLARGPAYDLFSPGKHGSTFGGNPFACRVAMTVLDVMEQENLADHAEKIGDYLRQGLKKALASYAQVVDIRGQGLMIGIELDAPCKQLTSIGLEHRLLFSIVSQSVIRLTPPLILTHDEADEVILRLQAILKDVF